jgi:hypothetical protein
MKGVERQSMRLSLRQLLLDDCFCIGAVEKPLLH